MEQNYNFTEIEKKWQQRWKERKQYKVNINLNKKKLKKEG
mgnify:CR=1 FL=1